ncbi:MAG: aromatic ring-opening dioxygenase subunit LigA [Rhodospirillales bacterium]|nr:aromatic ring-opening dioxygenase subunit LigA [Rhodospirillales bacterium]
MSLYYLQKVLYELNRDAHVRERYEADFDDLLRDYDLTDEEKRALTEPDIGLLYVLGVNGQLLMHFAALCGLEWEEYKDAMRGGIRKHGQVRAGLYAMVDDKNYA